MTEAVAETAQGHTRWSPFTAAAHADKQPPVLANSRAISGLRVMSSEFLAAHSLLAWTRASSRMCQCSGCPHPGHSERLWGLERPEAGYPFALYGVSWGGFDGHRLPWTLLWTPWLEGLLAEAAGRLTPLPHVASAAWTSDCETPDCSEQKLVSRHTKRNHAVLPPAIAPKACIGCYFGALAYATSRKALPKSL